MFPMADLASNHVFHWSQWLLKMKKGINVVMSYMSNMFGH